MARQAVPLRTAGLTEPILVDAATATFFHQLKNLLAQGGFHPDDPLLALYDVPGLVYVCGGVSPEAPWYFSKLNSRNCHAFDVTNLPLRKACTILTEPTSTGIRDYLHAHGIE